jgi:type VI secretion system secreted protein Hcp
MDLIIMQPGDPAILSSVSRPSLGVPAKPDFMTGEGFELVSLHQGMKQPMSTDITNSARTSGRPVITEITCVKYVDQISVKLYDLCLRAKPLGTGAAQPTLIYIARNSGDSTTNIVKMALRDAMISEIQLQTQPNDMPTEQFKINFTEILWTYTTDSRAQNESQTVSAGWSLARNAPIHAFT